VRDQSTNRFSWTSDARALTWHRDAIADASVVDVRIWQSGTSVGGNWLPASGTPIGMQNQFTQTAASTTISWGKTASLTSLGATVEQLRGGYAVSDSSRPDAFALLGISSRLHAVAAFIEHSHQLGPFTTTLGERVAMVDEKKFLLEPRVAFAVAMTHGITLSGAFARSHQYTQSLYNDESVVDAMASLEVPVIASHGVPIASSTSGSMRLDVPIGFSALISAGTFARTFDDLVLAGATDGDPFAAHGFTAGHGEAYGGSLSMRDQVGRLDLQGLYTMTVVSREWAGEREYRPTFAPSADLLLSTGYHFGDNTVLRASGFMSAYRSTSPLYGAVAWEWQDMLASQREVSGSPQYSPAEVGVGRLAPYVRVDLGIRHIFAFGAPLRGRASIYANVDNLLDRRNAAGLIQDPLGNGTRTLGMMPRSLSFGLNLRF
jgi:hypothetical protein